jgi:hypothetical protein
MEVRELDWPYAVRIIMTSAQELATVRGHKETTAAHVSYVLHSMKAVRAIVATALGATTVEAALLVEPKATVVNATLSPALVRLLLESPPASGRTTAAFVEGFSTGHASAQRVGRVFSQHAAAVAAALDHPDLERIFKGLSSDWVKQTTPHVVKAVVRAQKGKHLHVSTRHVVLADLVMMDAALKRHGLAGLEQEITEVTELIDRTVGRDASRGGKVVISAGLFGAVAFALSNDTLQTELLAICFENDEALASVRKVVVDARERLAAAEPAKSQ